MGQKRYAPERKLFSYLLRKNEHKNFVFDCVDGMRVWCNSGFVALVSKCVRRLVNEGLQGIGVPFSYGAVRAGVEYLHLGAVDVDNEDYESLEQFLDWLDLEGDGEYFFLRSIRKIFVFVICFFL